MDCEKVRDRFSSLWEKELSTFEEKILKEHLSACPECQREFEQFEKTMRWLHSVGDVGVPEGFIQGLSKKREEKKGLVPGEKPGGKWFHFPLSYKLPAQAVAMVAIVFLVLYVTRMMPTGGGHLKETKQIPSPLALQERREQGLGRSATPPQPETESEASPNGERKAEKGHPGSTLSEPSSIGRGGQEWTQKENEQRALGTSREKVHPKDSEQAESPVPGEKKRDGTYAPEIPSPKSKVMAYQQMESKGAGRENNSSPARGEMRPELAVPKKSLVASKPSQEIVLKISDRKEIIPRLQELVKKVGGDVVATDGDTFLASLPTGSFSEFEKELAELSSPGKADRLISEKHDTESLGMEEGTRRKEGDRRSKESARLAADKESRTIVRILLVEE